MFTYIFHFFKSTSVALNMILQSQTWPKCWAFCISWHKHLHSFSIVFFLPEGLQLLWTVELNLHLSSHDCTLAVRKLYFGIWILYWGVFSVCLLSNSPASASITGEKHSSDVSTYSFYVYPFSFQSKQPPNTCSLFLS